jgi:putative FmdB family regulatory protein
MPIYEFECEDCGERSEALVDVGTEAIECRHCGSGGTHRVLSAQAPSMRLVKSRGDARKQEAVNAKMHGTAKARFKETRRKQREKKGSGGSK